MYHTQEKWTNRLNQPKQCTRTYAWLGNGYYFWDDLVDAIQWGHKSKKTTGYFEIYKADIECDTVLDTVFNEENYKFWVKQIEKAAKHISIATGYKPTIKEINQYFKDKTQWLTKIDGILFQDLPNSEDLLVVELFYRKRIQLVVYNLKIIESFDFHYDMKCN